MPEYIEREAVLAEADYDGNFVLVVPAKKIRNIPAADVAPVVHGYWLRLSRGDQCSVCGYTTGRYEVGGKHCVECGARMDAKEIETLSRLSPEGRALYEKIMTELKGGEDLDGN